MARSGYFSSRPAPLCTPPPSARSPGLDPLAVNSTLQGPRKGPSQNTVMFMPSDIGVLTASIKAGESRPRTASPRLGTVHHVVSAARKCANRLRLYAEAQSPPGQDRTSPQAKPVLHYCGGAPRNTDCGSPTPNVLAIKARATLTTRQLKVATVIGKLAARISVRCQRATREVSGRTTWSARS